MTRTIPLTLLVAAIPLLARAADLAPGSPSLTADLADRKRDAVEAVFGFQMTARQLAEHRRLYALCWKYAPADWQRAEAAALAEFGGVHDKPAAAVQALRDKYQAAWRTDLTARAAQGNPYSRWLLAQADAAVVVVAPGDPPLRRDALDGFVEFLDWGMDLRLSPAKRAELAGLVVREWMRSFDAADRAALGGQVLPLYRKVLRMSDTERESARAKVTPALVELMQKGTAPTDRWLVAAHREARRILDPNTPPLTGAAVALGPVFFEWALGVTLPADAHRLYRDELARQWKTFPEADRKGIVHTAELMRSPPAGAAGELQRARDRVAVLIAAAWRPDEPFNATLLAAYHTAQPAAGGPAVPSAGAVLAAGDPPLTEGAAEAARNFFEWVFGFAFTPAERAEFRTLQLDEWRRNDAEAMRGTLEVARFWAEAAAFPPADRELVRAVLRPQVLDGIRQTKDADPGNRWLLARYETRLFPDTAAAIELLAFQAGEATGQPADAPAVRAAAERAVAAAATADRDQAPLKLAELRAAWAGMSAADRQELRDEWAGRLPPLGLSPKLAAWQTAPARPSAGSPDAFLEAQRKLYQQQQATRMASEMLRMQHQTNMTIIRNMGSTPYKYEYRNVPRRK